MSDKPLFQGMDEKEQVYAPEDVPGTHIPPTERDVGGTAGSDSAVANEPPAAAPVANIGSSPSGAAAPPNIGHDEHGGAPGDPETQAEYPLDDEGSRSNRR